MCLEEKACEDPTKPGVWWRDDAEWKRYDASQAAAILRGVDDGACTVDLGKVVSLKYTGGARYVVDLRSMKQVNVASGYTRDVKIVTETPVTALEDDYTSVKKDELRACMKSIRSMKNMVFKLESDLLAVKLQLLKSESLLLLLLQPTM